MKFLITEITEIFTKQSEFCKMMENLEKFRVVDKALHHVTSIININMQFS